MMSSWVISELDRELFGAAVAFEAPASVLSDKTATTAFVQNKTKMMEQKKQQKPQFVLDLDGTLITKVPVVNEDFDGVRTDRLTETSVFVEGACFLEKQPIHFVFERKRHAYAFRAGTIRLLQLLMFKGDIHIATNSCPLYASV